MSEHDLYETTDAMVWAEAFCERFSIHNDDGVIEDGPGLMVGWFANAMATAESYARQKEGTK